MQELAEKPVRIQVPWYPPPPNLIETEPKFLRRIYWDLNQRLFAWNALPSLGQLPFIRSSYIILIGLPILHSALVPVFSAEILQFNLPFLRLYNDDTSVEAGLRADTLPFEIRTTIAYNWYLIYLLTLFLTIGSIVYQIFHPKTLGGSESGALYLKVVYNFRDVASGLQARRQSLFLHNFLPMFAINYAELMAIPPESAGKNIQAIPPYDPNAVNLVGRRSIYYCASKMVLKEDYLDEAFSLTIWFSNETNVFWRWLSGLAFVAAIMISAYLFLQGFNVLFGPFVSAGTILIFIGAIAYFRKQIRGK